MGRRPRGGDVGPIVSILQMCKTNRTGKKWEESNALVAMAQKGDLGARNEVILINIGLVLLIAKRYVREGLLLDDLIGYGVEGLIRSISKFDSKKGVQFSTYATIWIKQCISRSVINNESTIRIPTHKAAKIAKANKVAKDNGSQEEDVPVRVFSLSRKVGKEYGYGDEFINLIPSKGHSPEENVADSQFAILRDALKSRLSATQYFVLERRFGLGGIEESSLEEIGRELGFTREYIRQIEFAALKKARKILKGSFI